MNINEKWKETLKWKEREKSKNDNGIEVNKKRMKKKGLLKKWIWKRMSDNEKERECDWKGIWIEKMKNMNEWIRGLVRWKEKWKKW